MLEFEEPIKNLEDKIEELRNIGSDGKVNIVEEINVLQKKCNILISTDLGSRGLDFSFLSHVLNFDFPITT